MSLSDVLEIKSWLKAQHVAVSSEWIQACIEFIKEERRGRNLTLMQLKSSIYEQWLVADLEEIGASSLPVDLQSVKKVTLNGTFALQVNGLRDISKPAYVQLKEFEGTTNDNTEVSATPQETLPEWEMKPTRMLLLNLFDGCTHIQGMEYKAIPFLSPNLPPGAKVLVKGPVECRFGLLMLTAENFKILGGEVESNLRKYSRETILKNILQLSSSENDAPNNNPQRIDVNSSSEINHGVQSTNSVQISHNVSPSRSNASSILNEANSNPPRQTGICNRTSYASSSRDSYEVTNNFNKRDNDARPSKSSNSNENQFSSDLDQFYNDDDDDFVQNLDFCSIDEIERKSQSQVAESNDVFDEWQDDEDVMQDLMSFQESRPEVELPFPDLKNVNDRAVANPSKCIDMDSSAPFTYISSIPKVHYKELLITIKGFIITVASKLACTTNDGWQLTVKVNDGTDSIDADIHNQVLENFIGISAKNVIKAQEQTSENVEELTKIKEAVSNCKLKLQNLNCLMDIKFSSNARPCIVNCFSIEKSHLDQLLERVRTHARRTSELLLLSQ